MIHFYVSAFSFITGLYFEHEIKPQCPGPKENSVDRPANSYWNEDFYGPQEVKRHKHLGM